MFVVSKRGGREGKRCMCVGVCVCVFVATWSKKMMTMTMFAIIWKTGQRGEKEREIERNIDK